MPQETKVECQIFIERKMITIRCIKDPESNEVSIKCSIAGGSVDHSVVSMINIVSETIQAYQKGVALNRWFVPNRNAEKDSEVIKCQWKKDGTLRVIEDPAKKKYLHANNATEAMKRARNFTCTRYTYRVCSKTRSLRRKESV